MTNFSAPRILVAMDFDEAETCRRLARQLSPEICRLKVGKELFTRCGPAMVEELMGLGFDIFLDLKFHDIPNTTAKAVKAAAALGVWMVNVHASGGERMLRAAREAVETSRGPRPLLIGVTVLTSMDAADLAAVGVTRPLEEQVLSLAGLTRDCGLDGIVCSAREAPGLRNHLGQDFCLVTPGIRLADSPPDDQRRTLTPREALESGSSYLVIGRPITAAQDPAAACRAIHASIQDMYNA